MRMSTLFGSMGSWLYGRSLGTGKRHRNFRDQRRGHAYFHDFESGEQRYYDRPGCSPDLRGQVCFPVFGHDLGFQADSLAFDVLEFHEGFLGDVDGLLEGMKKIHQQNVRSKASKAALDGKGNVRRSSLLG